MADQYSKELANKILTGELQAPYSMSIGNAFKVAADIVTKSRQLHWDNHDKARYTYNLIPSVCTKVIFPKSREIGVSYCRLLLHDSLPRDDSHRTGTSDTPYCEDCGVRETSDHFLPERDYVTFGSLLSQFRLSVCRLSSVCNVGAPYSGG